MNRSPAVPLLQALAVGVLTGVAALSAGSPETTLGWSHEEGGQFLAVDPLGSGAPGFTRLLPQQTGIVFTNALPEERQMTNQILLNGSGVAAGDVDGDGWCDLYFCGLSSRNRLYRNLGGWKFEDITERAGLARAPFDATGAAFCDLDGDGDLDLIVNSLGHGTYVYLNGGQGHFTELAEVLNPGLGGTSLALGDIDGDGRLDLYIANYRVATLNDAPDTRFSVRMVDNQPVVALIDGRPLTDPEWTNRFTFKIRFEGEGRGRFSHEENGEVDALYRNLGSNRFERVPFVGGSFLDEDGKALPAPPFDWGLTVTMRDLNGDHAPDLYVCNDFASPDRIWINDGQGRFRALPRGAIRQTSLASMSLDIGDLNRDGFEEMIVVDMLSREHRRRLVQRNLMRAELASTDRGIARAQYPRNTLFLNRGDGTYAEIAQYAGLEASEWSWAPVFLDVDLDGYEDLLVSNGFLRDNMNLDAMNRINAARAGRKLSRIEALHLRREFPRLATPNLAFRNLGDLRFQEVSRQWGFDTPTISQGTCLADLDNDGDLEVIVNNMNDVAGLYRNNGGAPRVGVRLRGQAPNTRGIGAKIWVYGGAVPAQSQEMLCGGRYLSCDDTMRVFAAGTLTNRMRIEVNWRSGRRSRVDDVRGNRIYAIDEAGAEAAVETPKRAAPPVFEEVSRLLGHRHVDEPYDDFARQPLLPKRLSELGPGVAWYDLDGDGRDDLIIGSGKGGRLAAYRNDGRGGFKPFTEAAFNQAVTRDQTTVLGWTPRPGQRALLIGSANYEDGLTAGGSVQQYDPATHEWTDLLAGEAASTGPLALADVDGDGDLDLFVGGRVAAGRYPEAASSRLYRNEQGRLQPDLETNRILAGVGLVSGAVFSDLNGDGFPELVLACEWGPIRIFGNERGHLREITHELGFDAYPGWWNGVTTGDFDGDGQLDIVASNWGRNSKYESHRARALRIYYGDFDGDGSFDLVEAYDELTMGKVVPERMLDVMTKAMPFLAERFTTHQAYAETSVEEVLGERLRDAKQWQARWLETTVFFNRQVWFDARILPMEAQLAPAFAVCVGDYDGDGNDDIFLSQNFFGVGMDTSRYDAGRGLWLQGDGRGGFRAVPGQESGVKIYGEQRGAALADYDGDGRVDLVVTQNSAETILLRNTRGRPGLRVRLKGPEGNPLGVGAVLRLRCGEQWGPAREVHAGSGYWSQDSAVAVLGMPTEPTGLWVRWPAGKTMVQAIPSGTREVVVSEGGGSEGVR